MHITLSQKKKIKKYIYKNKNLCFFLYTRLQLITRRDRCWVALRLSLPPQWVCALVNKQVVSELKCYLTRQQIPSPRVRIQTSNSVFKSKDRKISSRLFLTEIISQPRFLTKSPRMKLYTFCFPSSPLRNSQDFKGTLKVTAQCTVLSKCFSACFVFGSIRGPLPIICGGAEECPTFSNLVLCFPNTSSLLTDVKCQFHNIKSWHEKTSHDYLEALKKLHHPKKES